MSKIVAAVAISLVAGFSLGAWIGGDEAESGGGEPDGLAAPRLELPDTLDERVASLEQTIAEESEARFILEEQLQNLISEIERIDAAGSRMNAGQADSDAASRVERLRERRSQRDPTELVRTYQEQRLNNLINGGFSEDEARRVLRLESEAQFKAMQAAWEAQRNGESLDPFAAMSGPQSILRAELGDTAYERYLEAQGQRTSIEISRVLDGSPGSRAGLEPGDQIFSYNGERVFSVTELRNLTMQGNPGEDVIVEVDRDGVRMQLSLQRGPVGITGSGANIRTMNWWGGG